MMKLPESVRVGIDLVKLLRQSNGAKPLKTVDLAPALHTTFHFAQQIVFKMRRSKLINVIRGPGGGVTASLNPISVLKICQSLGYYSDQPNMKTESGRVAKAVRKALELHEV